MVDISLAITKNEAMIRHANTTLRVTALLAGSHGGHQLAPVYKCAANASQTHNTQIRTCLTRSEGTCVQHGPHAAHLVIQLLALCGCPENDWVGIDVFSLYIILSSIARICAKDSCIHNIPNKYWKVPRGVVISA